MIEGRFVRTHFEWLDILASKSAIVSRLDIKRSVSDEIYRAMGDKITSNIDAFNLAGSESHNVAIAQTIENLAKKGVSDGTLRKLVVDLTSRNTYGTFSEMSAYAFLLKGDHDFEVQVPVTGIDILNPNGANLDGLLKLSTDVLFDIKAFGFHGYLIRLIVDRLTADCAPEFVAAEESWDVPIPFLFNLLSAGYTGLRQELKSKRFAQRGAVRFVLKSPARVQVSAITLDPYRLAKVNADYAFRYAKQFARSKPFFLFFVIHPWTGGGLLHVNFAGMVDKFTRAFARRTFMQFRDDQSVIFGVTKSEASELLSGIVFVNAFEGENDHRGARYRCFLNPFAKNKISSWSRRRLIEPYGYELMVDDFEDDAY